ncbi:hypothetical protein DXG01_001890 [Tephrocybe rancida]|nr:hypothetical protein DXG01_001890 [Tephrocybe rancida]
MLRTYGYDILPYGLQQNHRRFDRAANFGILGSWDLRYCVVDWVGNSSTASFELQSKLTIMDTLLVRHSMRGKVRGGRTPTSAIWELEDLRWLPGKGTPAKGPAKFRFPVTAIES